MRQDLAISSTSLHSAQHYLNKDRTMCAHEVPVVGLMQKLLLAKLQWCVPMSAAYRTPLVPI